MATHSSILAWRNPRTEERSGLQSTEVRKSRTRVSDQTTKPMGLVRNYLRHRLQPDCSLLGIPLLPHLSLDFSPVSVFPPSSTQAPQKFLWWKSPSVSPGLHLEDPRILSSHPHLFPLSNPDPSSSSSFLGSKDAHFGFHQVVHSPRPTTRGGVIIPL